MGSTDLEFYSGFICDQGTPPELNKKICALNEDEWLLLDGVNLTLRELECLFYYYWFGKKQKEIAKRLKIKRSTVVTHLLKAKRKIGKHYNIINYCSTN